MFIIGLSNFRVNAPFLVTCFVKVTSVVAINVGIVRKNEAIWACDILRDSAMLGC